MALGSNYFYSDFGIGIDSDVVCWCETTNVDISSHVLQYRKDDNSSEYYFNSDETCNVHGISRCELCINFIYQNHIEWIKEINSYCDSCTGCHIYYRPSPSDLGPSPSDLGPSPSDLGPDTLMSIMNIRDTNYLSSKDLCLKKPKSFIFISMNEHVPAIITNEYNLYPQIVMYDHELQITDNPHSKMYYGFYLIKK